MELTTQRPADRSEIAAIGAEEVTAICAKAARLERDGDLLGAARWFDRIPALQRGPGLDEHMVRLRHRAFPQLADQPAPTTPWPPPSQPDLFPGVRGAPEIAAADLDRDHVASAIEHHGCLIVRGLLDEPVSARLRAVIDAAFDSIERSTQGVPISETSPWYAPLELDPGYELEPMARMFLYSAGGVHAAAAPRGFLEYAAILRELGMLDLVAQYLEEPVVLSLNKCVFRRLAGGRESTWHQDGAYLGANIRALDLWITLSECGGDTDAAGLDLLPRPMTELAEVGGYDAVDPRLVSQHVVAQLCEEADVVVERPHFQTGDAMLFNQLFVHRSDVRPAPRTRYAIESWFFAPSTYPDNQIPVVAT